MATAGSDLLEQHGSAPAVLGVNDEVHLFADEEVSPPLLLSALAAGTTDYRSSSRTEILHMAMKCMI